MYPRGYGAGKNQSLSLYLKADWVKQNPRLRLYAEFKLRMKNQLNSTCHVESTSEFVPFDFSAQLINPYQCI